MRSPYLSQPGAPGQKSGRSQNGSFYLADRPRPFRICNGGFIDVRPHAILRTAKNDTADLDGRVFHASTEDERRTILGRVEPYGYFTTCGLLAVLFRLKALYSRLEVADFHVGTLQDYRWHMPRDGHGHILMVPGIGEAMRMVSEGLEKLTGTEGIDGCWG